MEIDKALEELRKATPDDTVYKTAGPILIKSKRDDLIKELEEKKELLNTRIAVLSKQEARLKENLKEVQGRIDEIIRGGVSRPRAE